MYPVQKAYVSVARCVMGILVSVSVVVAASSDSNYHPADFFLDFIQAGTGLPYRQCIRCGLCLVLRFVNDWFKILPQVGFVCGSNYHPTDFFLDFSFGLGRNRLSGLSMYPLRIYVLCLGLIAVALVYSYPCGFQWFELSFRRNSFFCFQWVWKEQIITDC